MSFKTRPATQVDYPAIVALLNHDSDHPTSVPEFEHQERNRPADRPFLRLVAEQDGQVVGIGTAGRVPWLRQEDMYCFVRVLPEYQRQGVGMAIYEALYPLYQQHQPEQLWGYLRDDRAESLAWAERRGFATRHHTFGSVLDLTAFDAQPFAGAVDRLKAQGVGFVPFDQIRTPETERKLWALFQECDRDVPDADDSAPLPFEEWFTLTLGHPRSWPAGCILAIDDAGNWMGMTALKRSTIDPTQASIDFTAVRRGYRGRGIALAVKLESVAFAVSQGVTHLATYNHSANAPMLAINRKLGFVPKPGSYSVAKPYAKK